MSQTRRWGTVLETGRPRCSSVRMKTATRASGPGAGDDPMMTDSIAVDGDSVDECSDDERDTGEADDGGDPRVMGDRDAALASRCDAKPTR